MTDMETVETTKNYFGNFVQNIREDGRYTYHCELCNKDICYFAKYNHNKSKVHQLNLLLLKERDIDRYNQIIEETKSRKNRRSPSPENP